MIAESYTVLKHKYYTVIRTIRSYLSAGKLENRQQMYSSLLPVKLLLYSKDNPIGLSRGLSFLKLAFYNLAPILRLLVPDRFVTVTAGSWSFGSCLLLGI